MELVSGRARYCTEHERQRQRKQFRRRYKAGKVVDYGPEWPGIRKRFLEENPLCVVCGAKATEVDHISPFRESQSHDWDNLQAMCKPCHSRKTASQDGGFGNARRGGA